MAISNIRIDFVLSALLSDLELRDDTVKYILRRFSNEGMYFLTNILPEVGKAVIKGLETGFFDRTSLTSFAWKNATLLYLGEVINLIFDKKSGLLLNDASATAIKTVRVISEFFYKLAIPYDEQTMEKAQANFIQNEVELGCIAVEAHSWAETLRKDFETQYSALSNATVSQVLSDYRPRPTSGTFIGAKRDYFFERVSTLRRRFPRGFEAYSGYYKSYPGMKFSSKIPNARVEYYANRDGDYSELLFVPKDSRGPRTICREFRMRVETQMAYFDWMTNHLPIISKGAINFQDQGVNRALAAIGSCDRTWSTLDLKDASDRVSFALIKTIFRNSNACRWFILGANRAKNVLLPKGEIRKLNKLAGMGSGLTFPTMALLISLTICRVVKNCTHYSYDYIRQRVYVYGDDIIVPREWTEMAYRALANVGLKVNSQKSFRNGFFRESCGGDYYRGADVTPMRMKLASSKPVYSHVSRSLTFEDEAAATNQLYELAKTAHQQGYEALTNTLLGSFEKGFLTPGRIQPDGAFTDFRKKTRHLNPYLDYTVHYPSSGTMSLLDITVRLKRDPYHYLSERMRGINGLKEGDAYRRNTCFEASTPSDFGTLTIPRTIVIKTKKLAGDFLLSDDTSVESFVEKLAVQRIVNRLSKSSVTSCMH